ncbi:hypothetical protein K461DRAFT_273268 [Myriangium duriaei CBS 260.36]|uniref:Uncharacterized protein n=1 Tax=Myriangium duriaei CBS 260.36 TaxID=1168546 RepID=A0A9P4J8X9_9PEZI|nr:hypothetical protein K461DRAFT_273268 [Myriangium duriaei CBS 260.36]
MTNRVLDRLELTPEVPSSSRAGHGFDKILSSFPIEIHDLILEHFLRAGDLEPECNNFFDASCWRRALIRGCLPWLWDLDKDAIAAREAERSGGRDWDWEALVRRLGRRDLYMPVHDEPADFPRGLRNRRRIWQLVMDMKSPIPKSESDGRFVGLESLL